MKTEIKPVPVVQVVYPPAALYQDCEAPPVTPLKTVGDMADLLLEYRFAFDKCSSKVRNLRTWVENSENVTK